VGEVRLKGFIGAIELVKDKKTRASYQPQGEVGTICRDHCFAIGLVMRATRDTMLISPPLSWTRAEIDEFLTLTRKALDLTLADVKRRFN
jgi:putrescine aminotransferase